MWRGSGVSFPMTAKVYVDTNIPVRSLAPNMMQYVVKEFSFKGNQALAEVERGEEDTISTSAILFAVIEIKFGI